MLRGPCHIGLILVNLLQKAENTVYTYFYHVVCNQTNEYEITRQFNGKTYRYVVTSTTDPSKWVTFYTAENDCKKWGGHLTSIHTDQEFNFIKVCNLLYFTICSMNRNIEKWGTRLLAGVPKWWLRSCFYSGLCKNGQFTIVCIAFLLNLLIFMFSINHCII